MLGERRKLEWVTVRGEERIVVGGPGGYKYPQI
jgi:hypothetical protein